MTQDLSTLDARKGLAAKYAAKYAIDPVLISCVIQRESYWNPWAVRYEPAFYSRYIQSLLNRGEIHTLTEANTRAMSWGLMQVMGQVAREYGFTGHFLSELCDPDVGVDYGCKKLRKSLDQHPGDVRAALLAYNGGGDPGYPDLVLQFAKTYQDQDQNRSV